MAKKTETQLATLPASELSVGQMLSGALGAIQSRQITAADVDVLSRMMDLYERDEKRRAEKQFAEAFHALMAEIPTIAAIKPIPGKDGTIKYHVAPLDEIDRQLRPMATKHGFTYRWAEEPSPLPDRITETCIVQHIGGHKEISPYTVRRSAPQGANDSQADMSTHSYGRRGSLCDAFGIVIDKSDDARLIGKTITIDEARELKARLEYVQGDEKKFLDYAGAETFEAITEDRYEGLLAWLEKKEEKVKAERGANPQPAPELPTTETPPEKRNAKGEYEW